MSTYYFDTNALLKYYGRGGEKGRLALRRLVSSSSTILLSPLTQIEYMHVIMKEVRRKHIRKAEATALVERLRRDINASSQKSTRPFTAVALPDGCFRRGESLLLNYPSVDIGTIDALHIAIAEKLAVEHVGLVLATSDRGMQFVCKQINLAFFDAETA